MGSFAMITLTFSKQTFFLVFGVLGILFYIISPVLFPDIPSLRQPELLPVYTLMIGLSQLKPTGIVITTKSTQEAQQRAETTN